MGWKSRPSALSRQHRARDSQQPLGRPRALSRAALIAWAPRALHSLGGRIGCAVAGRSLLRALLAQPPGFGFHPSLPALATRSAPWRFLAC